MLYLAENDTRTPEERLDRYEQAISAGIGSIDADDWARHRGALGQAESLAPYMQACAGKVRTLAELGRDGDVITAANQLLAMDPSDPYQVAWLLLNAQLKTDDVPGAAATARGGATLPLPDWTYNVALARFRHEGDTRWTRRKRDEALALNSLAAEYITGERDLPRRPPKRVDISAKSFAIAYALNDKQLWQETPGAVDWLGAGQAHFPTHVEKVDPTGAGSRFLLSLLSDYETCPECDNELELGRSWLAILLDTEKVLVLRVRHGHCPVDNLLVIEQGTLEERMVHEVQHHHPHLIGRDYVVLGTVPANAAEALPTVPTMLDAVNSHLTLFREEVEDDEEMLGAASLWPLGLDLDDFTADELSEEPDDERLAAIGSPQPALLNWFQGQRRTKS